MNPDTIFAALNSKLPRVVDIILMAVSFQVA